MFLLMSHGAPLSVSPPTAAFQPGIPFVIVEACLQGPNLPPNQEKLIRNLYHSVSP